MWITRWSGAATINQALHLPGPRTMVANHKHAGLSMHYTIFTCKQAMDVLRTYGESYGVVVPIEHYKQFNIRKHKILEGHRAAIPGFAFVPMDQCKELRRRALSSFNLRQLFHPSGNPLIILQREIEQLQDRLEREYAGANTFKVGERVTVHFHPLNPSGIEGDIVKFRKSGNARVKLHKLNSFVEVPQVMLSKSVPK